MKVEVEIDSRMGAVKRHPVISIPFSRCSLYYWGGMSGIYIHIPFCIKKCSYCDFYSVPFSRNLAEKYVQCLTREIELFFHHAGGRTVTGCKTIYIGGGTPSCLEPGLFRSITASLFDHVDNPDGSEFTLEVNPGTLSSETLDAYREAGVNRISIGAQTFNDRHLKKLGRIHRKRDICDAAEMTREWGFSNVNMDLIFGIPLQSENEVIADVIEALRLTPTHISAYALSIEEGTPLFEEVQGGLVTPSDDEYAAIYGKLDTLLSREGYHHYEISNFAIDGFECAHNIGYWTGEEYYAFGAGASGYLKDGQPPGGYRYTNFANLGDYIKAIEREQLPRAEVLSNDISTIWKERLIMGLRLIDGICISRIQEELGAPPPDLQKSIDRLLDEKLLQKDGETLKIPEQHVFTSNEILTRLV